MSQATKEPLQTDKPLQAEDNFNIEVDDAASGYETNPLYVQPNWKSRRACADTYPAEVYPSGEVLWWLDSWYRRNGV